MDSAFHVIQGRKSTRTFDGRPISTEDRHALAVMLEQGGNPFGVPVEFHFLDAEKHGLKSPAVVGERYYVAAKVERVPNCEIAFGYEFERFCLEAEAIGLGTVMLAASLNREAFERAIDVSEGEVMPVASPVGYPAAKRSVRERAMRKALGADGRMPFGELFFDGVFDKPLTPEGAGELRQAFEAVRLAPSAGNKQPWRVVLEGESAHFYECRTIGESPLGDIQKVDLGIALLHFDIVANEAGFKTSFDQDDPGIQLPDGVEYIATCRTSR